MDDSHNKTEIAWERLVGWIDSEERPEVLPINEVRHAVAMAIRAAIGEMRSR